ncbi:uncharacterized protein A4U43_C01F7700 [Asparagus officinalis]|uniref:LOW protein: ammonium transporter 1-like protein n=1 Tax=Asparagus officinalis TaxID=4686 RepID=A0A5P1FMW5_ASPOF|nr:uncharacterized protein LOC109851105 [Asparagus officinalis]ONK79568.1 uncharacterized protein A4U43_C01F7700 [Asparagus officinalis]
MASLFFSPTGPSHLTPHFLQNPHHIPSLLLSFKPPRTKKSQALTICSALTESNSPKSLDDDEGDILPLLQELAESFDLPSDYFGKLPRDLRLDLNDAAFDLANGAVIDECGRELGEMLLNLSRAWEKADTSTSNSITCQLPSLHRSLRDDIKSAFGRRLISAGRRFQSMGQYGEGELEKIAKSMIKTGKVLSRSPAITTDKEPKEETRILKFGDLQVELTREKAYIGAAIGVVFGFVSWELSQSIQSIPENSLQYANDNALQLAKSLRGTLIVIGFSSTILSALTSVGLLLLARQLSSGREDGEH